MYQVPFQKWNLLGIQPFNRQTPKYGHSLRMREGNLNIHFLIRVIVSSKMPFTKAPRCGFFQTIVFYECKIIDQLRDYTGLMRGNNKDLCLPDPKWSRKRREQKRILRDL